MMISAAHIKKSLILTFWSGFLTHNIVLSLLEDIYGKEAWIKFIENHWISGWYTVPLALFGACVCWRMVVRAEDILRTGRLNLEDNPNEDISE